MDEERSNVLTHSGDAAMSAPLITTKLFVPQPHPGLVRRPRLIQRLQEGLSQGRRLTLLSAPAGYGKTTLLGEWMHGTTLRNSNCEMRNRTAWLSLDAGDNDLSRFLAYLIAALDTVEDGLGMGARSLLGSSQPLPAQAILTPVINGLAAVSAPLTLVLDDYQVITAQPVHEAVAFLLDHLPPGAHLVIATRTDPPLSLARLRARAQLTEIRLEDLRFTTEESAELLNQVAGLGLAAEDLAALEGRTEGWAAGLQMASLAIQALLSTGGPADIPRFVREFSGSHRYVLDYLLGEVLQHQPHCVQVFLLQTSILQRFCGPLCDAVLDWMQGNESWEDLALQLPSPDAQCASPGQAVLEYLDRANLFLVSLDGERRWYRYHRLFADLLRARLQRLQPGLEAALHSRAAQWFAENGWFSEAIDHALAAEDFERAAHLIGDIAPTTLWARGEVASLLGWLQALPERVLRARPRLGLYQAWALATVARVDEVVECLRHVEQAIAAAEGPVPPPTAQDDAQARAMSGEIAVLRAMIANFQGDESRVIELCQQALADVPAESLFLRGAIAGNLGGAYAKRGQVLAASQAFAKASRLSQETDNTFTALIATGYLGDMQVVLGRLHEADCSYRQVLALATARGVQELPLVGMAHVGLGRLLYEWNDLDGAMRHLLEGIRLGERQGDLVMGPGLQILLDGYLALARVRRVQGDVDALLELIRKSERWVRQHDPSRAAQVAVTQARLWLALGNTGAAARWLRDWGLGEATEYEHRREYEYLTLARLLLAQGRWGEAVGLLARLAEAAETTGRIGSLVEVLALQALALRAQGESARALAALARALSLAEPEGYVRTFVDEGEPMGELLREAQSQGVSPRYVGALLAALELSPVQPLAEPLSSRELEILRRIAAGYTNQQIAEEFVIALTTVKKHASNIFGKLGVTNRTRAVARGRELGII